MDMRHAPEIRRALNNFKFEMAPEGVFIPSMNRMYNGAFKHTLYGADGSRDIQIDPNLVVDQGLVKMLNVMFAGQAAFSAWYVSLFSGSYTPVAGLTGANYNGQATELVGYSGTRPAWVVTATSTTSIGNTGSEAMFNFDGSGPYTARGCGLHSVTAKGGITGELAAATRFATDRTGLNSPDKLGVEYVITAQDAG